MTQTSAADPILFSSTARDSIQSSLEEIVKHWEGVRLGKDPEAVHGMRVASRRLRASLSVFEPLFPKRQFDRFERKISYLTDALGAARDTDVFIEFLNNESDKLTPEQASEVIGLKEYLKHLKKQRDEEQVDLLKTLKRLDPAELQLLGSELIAALPERQS